MFRSRPISLLPVVLFVWVTGCTSYKQIGMDSVADYDVVSITTTDGHERKIRDPEIGSDSLRGRVQEPGRIGGPVWSDSVVAIPMASVAAVGVQESDAASTAGLVFVGALLLGLLAFAIAEGPFFGPGS